MSCVHQIPGETTAFPEVRLRVWHTGSLQNSPPWGLVQNVTVLSGCGSTRFVLPFVFWGDSELGCMSVKCSLIWLYFSYRIQISVSSSIWKREFLSYQMNDVNIFIFKSRVCNENVGHRFHHRMIPALPTQIVLGQPKIPRLHCSKYLVIYLLGFFSCTYFNGYYHLFSYSFVLDSFKKHFY